MWTLNHSTKYSIKNNPKSKKIQKLNIITNKPTHTHKHMYRSRHFFYNSFSLIKQLNEGLCCFSHSFFWFWFDLFLESLLKSFLPSLSSECTDRFTCYEKAASKEMSGVEKMWSVWIRTSYFTWVGCDFALWLLMSNGRVESETDW